MKIYILILLTIGSLFLVQSYEKKMNITPVYVSPSKNIGFYSFGYNQLVSSLLWVRMLQDIDVCDQHPEKILYPEIKENPDPLDEILTRELPISRCHKGWVFQMLDVISDLTPGFEAVYADGATFLSVLVDDRKGAQEIFAKGQSFFPENWEIHYRAAYHELFEMQDPDKAAVYLKRAGEAGAPAWVFALSAKLYSKMDQALFAKTILESVLARKNYGPHIERVKGQLRKINESLGLPNSNLEPVGQ